MPPVHERISAIVRERRRSFGWSQARLALEADVSIDTVRSAEAASSPRMSIETAFALADALGVNRAAMLGIDTPDFAALRRELIACVDRHIPDQP